MKQPTPRAQSIIDRYQSGLSSNAIAKELVIHPNSVLKTLKKYGIPRRFEGQDRKPDEEIREMEAMYNEGYTLEEVGKAFDIGPSLVLRYFRRLNIPRRSAEEAHRKYAINEDFFDNIDTEEKAYFLGFLYADGCNQMKHSWNVAIALSSLDKEILYKLSALIYRDPEIAYDQVRFYDRTHEDNGKGSNKGIEVKLCINSKHICLKLMDWGCVSTKTFVLTFPKWLDNKLHRHFVRGYFDGDGTIYNETNKMSGCGLISTKEFCEGVKNAIVVNSNLYKVSSKEEDKDKNTWNLSINGNRNIQKFLNWMYAGSKIHLERKYQAYLRFCHKMEEIDRKMIEGTRGYPKAYLSRSYPDYHQILTINDVELTGDNVAAMNDEEKRGMANDAFDYLRSNGFNFTFDDKIREQYKDLCNVSKDEAKTTLLNNNRLCTLLCKLYCKDFYYNARYKDKPSIVEAFNDDGMLMRCIENRFGMSWKTDERFNISFANIIGGFVSSGICYNVSIFKPTIAKYLCEQYSEAGDKVLDYSAGWGTRMLGAVSCGRRYIGIDPLTIPGLLKMKTNLNLSEVELIQGQSESVLLDDDSIDFAFSSPPYFDLEVYSNDNTQAYMNGKDHFYNVYWKQTLTNVKRALKPGKWFGLNVSEAYSDMVEGAREYFGDVIEDVAFYMPRTHFSKNKMPKAERMYMFRNTK